jgi:Protein of unknown function (DUF4058)
MRNPFPGMDPYLEDPAFWPDFHVTFINYWREALAERLPDHYEARIDERVNLVELPDERVKRIKPDVAVSQRGTGTTISSATGGLAVLEPVIIPLVIEDETRETYIEILHRPERALVAVLELLSPANKEEPGRRLYLTKRNALLHHDVHLVELDLLLSGHRLPLEGAYPAGHYFALVSRADRRPDCDVYYWTVREPLPAIPIPLRNPDADVVIDLATVFTTAYERGRYARSLRYDKPPNLPAGTVDLDWITAEAKSAKKT